MRLAPLPTAPGARGLALVGAAALVVLAAASARELGRGAALATGLLGLGVALLVVRRGRPGAAPAPVIVLRERLALGRDAGLALVSAGRRRVVVGYGSAGVTVVAELAAGADAGVGEGRP